MYECVAVWLLGHKDQAQVGCLHPVAVPGTGLFSAPVAGPHTGHTTVTKKMIYRFLLQ